MGRFIEKLDEIDRTFALDPDNEGWKRDRPYRLANWALFGVFLVVLLGCAAWTEHQDGRIADRLRRDGVEVEARVVDNRSGKDIGGPFEEVRVVFDTIDGRHVETWAVTGMVLFRAFRSFDRMLGLRS